MLINSPSAINRQFSWYFSGNYRRWNLKIIFQFFGRLFGTNRLTMSDYLPGNFQPERIQPEKILVVDDTAYNIRLAAGILQRKGYQIFQALDGLTALAKAAEILPDLILLDIKMRGIDGYEVCQQLKENPKTADIPVIFISGLDELGDKVKAFGCGGVDYITKPFQPVEVLLRVENQLNLRSLQRTLKEKNLLL